MKGRSQIISTKTGSLPVAQHLFWVL
uniref:Uncharacterized protein n=1 Tax=Arundo donax TaxID=35708 RepID=A0A0A8Z2F2_ARUDO